MRANRRRLVLAGAGLVASPLVRIGSSSANPPSERVVRVGLMASGTAPRWARVATAVEAAFRLQGYVEGQNLVLHRRFATFPEAAMAQYAGWLARNSDVIVTTCGWTAALAAKATATVPVVMGNVGDPVRMGFAESLTRPGKNMTGQFSRITELTPKMLEMLRMALPETTAVGALMDTKGQGQDDRLRELAGAARAMQVDVTPFDLRALPAEAMLRDRIRGAKVQALIVLPGLDLIWDHLDRVVAAADDLRLPTVFPSRDFLEMGGFMSYGANLSWQMTAATHQVVRIINGANPAEMPIERPERVEFAINVKKAAAYGLTIPRAVLMRADTVI